MQGAPLVPQLQVQPPGAGHSKEPNPAHNSCRAADVQEQALCPLCVTSASRGTCNGPPSVGEPPPFGGGMWFMTDWCFSLMV
jgi:hypothetical protein